MPNITPNYSNVPVTAALMFGNQQISGTVEIDSEIVGTIKSWIESTPNTEPNPFMKIVGMDMGSEPSSTAYVLTQGGEVTKIINIDPPRKRRNRFDFLLGKK